MVVGITPLDGYINIKHPTWLKYKPNDPKKAGRHGIGTDSTIMYNFPD